MAYDFEMSHRELTARLHNPWKTFTRRSEDKHPAEDVARLCPSPQTASSEVIENFMTHQRVALDSQIPRRQQALGDYLNEAIVRPSRGAIRSVEKDIVDSSSSADIALLDDRQKHAGCMRLNGTPCSECNIYSANLSVPMLYRRLKEDRRAHKAEKRLVFIPNLTSAGALALAATTARRTAVPLRNFLHRYLERDHIFSISTSWGFFLEFHIPYHAMRLGPPSKDSRYNAGKRLRKTEVLPLRLESGDREELYFHEAQTSSLSLGPDEWFWTDFFLVDTYFGSERLLQEYLTNCQPGDGIDPPLGGRGRMGNHCFDPREYWLLKVDRRVLQVTAEYTALIETFNKRMEVYARKIRRIFEDDRLKTHTRTLSHVIETIQLFADCISATVDAWETFYRNHVPFFTVFARDKPEWSGRIDSIIRNIAELNRLRKLLLTKQERFKFKQDSLHTVSSLSQTETAIWQGEYIKTLTQMTVYTAFPLLFTTALFSMDFLHPKHPWLVFFAVLMTTSIVNYMVASHRSPFRKWLNDVDFEMAWVDLQHRYRV